MSDPNDRLWNTCACGNRKRTGNDVCSECAQREREEVAQRARWEHETFARKSYVVVHDPDGLMYPGAEFNAEALADMLANGYVSPDMIISSRHANSRGAQRLADNPRIAQLSREPDRIIAGRGIMISAEDGSQ